MLESSARSLLISKEHAPELTVQSLHYLARASGALRSRAPPSEPPTPGERVLEEEEKGEVNDYSLSKPKLLSKTLDESSRGLIVILERSRT